MADEAVASTGQHYSELVSVSWRVKVCKPGLLVYLPDNETRSQKKQFLHNIGYLRYFMNSASNLSCET